MAQITPGEIAKILETEIAKRMYQDGMSKPTTQIGDLLTDFIKTIRLFTAPIQLAAAAQDRLQKYLKEVAKRVPEEKQIKAEPTFAGAILERLVYVDDSNYLKKYYLNLLEKAIHSDLVSLAHPAFPSIIHQLSPDEILILETLRTEDIISSYEYGKDEHGNKIDWTITGSNFDINKLSFPNLRAMYNDHLQLLNLIIIKSEQSESYIPKSQNFHRKTRYKLTEFGRMFMKACKDN